MGYEWQGSVWETLSPDDKPQQLQNAFIRFISEITRHKPLLIKVDDAQWIDVQSREYFQALSTAEISPVMFIIACRYLDKGGVPDLELSNHQTHKLELNTLGKSGSRMLIHSLLNLTSVPEPTFTLIGNRAMGNPFFIEQLIFYLRENGKLDEQGNLTGDVSYISSFGISDIIGSRIDRLAESLRETISHASVLGMEFNVKVLARMLENEVKEELSAGTVNRIWKDLDELRYIFSHILIKDVVYQRMLSNRLQKLHETAAKAMEIIYADKLDINAEEIAYHFKQAGLELKAAEYYDKAGSYYRESYLFDRAETNLRLALEIRERLLENDNPDLAATLTNLAYLEQAKGNYEQAEELFRRSLEIIQTALGKEHPAVAKACNDLALICGDQGRYEDAELFFRQAMEIREKALGAEHPDTARSVEDLACLYETVGQYEQSEALHQRALSIWTKALGPEHLDTAVTLNNLASLNCSMGRFAEAEPLFLKVLAIFEQLFGAENPDTAVIMDNLGLLYNFLKQYDKAEPMLLKALATRQKILGAEHPDTANSLNNLSTLYRNMFIDDKAEQMCRQALAIREKSLGAEHPLTGMTYNNLARLAQDRKEYEQAEKLYRRSLQIIEASLGKEHPNTATILLNLGLLFDAQDMSEPAESYFQQALSIRQKSLEAEHPDLIYNLECLRDLYTKMGKPDKAKEYQAKLDIILNT